MRGIDNLSDAYDVRMKHWRVENLLAPNSIDWVNGDITDRDPVNKLVSEFEPGAVINLAARAGVRQSIDNPWAYYETNVTGTLNLLEACKDAGVSRFLLASSSSVYGNNEKIPFAETDSVDCPISPYAATKKAAELLSYTYHHLYGMHVTALRFFTVYGPRQRPDLAIHKFTRLIEAGRPIPVFGDGSMRRDHTYIDDIIAGVRAAIDRCDGYRIYNLGHANPVSLDDLIAALESALGKKAVIDRQPLQPGDVQQTYANVDRARAELGYEPATDLETGLRHFVNWFRTNG